MKHLIDAAETFQAEQPHCTLSPWLAAEVEYWRPCAAITDIVVRFDDGWSEDQRRLIVALAERACATLEERPCISAAEMRHWNVLDGVVGIETRGETEILTAPVVEVGRAVVTLLSGGKIEPPPGGSWFYGEFGRCVWQR